MIVLEQIEWAMAKSSFDGDRDSAEKFADVCQAIYDRNYVMAIIMAEMHGFPADIVDRLRNTYRVRSVI